MADFAYKPDPKKSSTWKLDISDARHTAAAVAALGKGFRGNKVEIPEKDLAGVKARVAAAYKKFFPKNDLPPVLKSLDVKVNDQPIEDPALFGTIVNAIACFFRNKDWQQQQTNQDEEDAEEALEDAGILPEDENSEDMEDMGSSEGYVVQKSLNDDLRQATFVVLEAEKVDAHGDIYSAEDVRKGCHSFNTYCRKAFLDHAEETDKASIVESYIAPTDIQFGEQRVSKGDWLAVVQFDKDLWKQVKDGTYDSLSIGAYAISEEI
jgi:hypothetical protein